MASTDVPLFLYYLNRYSWSHSITLNLHCINCRCVLGLCGFFFVCCCFAFLKKVVFNLLKVIIFHPVYKQAIWLHGESLYLPYFSDMTSEYLLN